MAKAEPWEPPEDPDFEQLATEGYERWQADRPEDVAFDTETTGVAYFDEPFCVTAAWYRPDGSVTGHYFELTKFDAGAMVSEILDQSTRLIGWNLKFDLQKVALRGLLFPHEYVHLHDAQILAHLVNEHRPLGLKDMMVTELKWADTMEVPYLSGPKAKSGETRTVVREKYLIQEARRKLKLKKEDGFHLIPRGIVVPYAISDAVGTLQLYTMLRPQVERHEDNWSCYAGEMELTRVLLDMEDAGLGVDLEYAGKQVKAYQNKVIKIDTEIQKIVGMPVGKEPKPTEEFPDGQFNPGSDDQIKAMFTKLGFERESYAKEILAEIDHPLARAILQRRDDSKMLTTYLRPIQSEQRDNILHPSFRQNVSTGRMASGKQKEEA